jgi:hypothetical protein
MPNANSDCEPIVMGERVMGDFVGLMMAAIAVGLVVAVYVSGI